MLMKQLFQKMFSKLPKNPYKFGEKEGHTKEKRTAMHCKERLNVGVVDIP